MSSNGPPKLRRKSDKSLFHGKYLKFKRNLNKIEDEIYRQYFQRHGSYGDVITLQDIRNFALFTLKSKISKEFLEFVFSETFDDFLHATVFYMDYFLMILELVLIRRDEIKEGKIRDHNSIIVEASFSMRLSHRRLLMSREFSKICMQMSAENARKFKVSNPAKELRFFDSLADFTIECTFICLHRRAYKAISEEILRLFGGKTETGTMTFDDREKQLLFGHAWYKKTSLHGRNAPLLTELFHATKTPSIETDDILKLGVEKYDGCDEYLLKLERFFTISEMHYVLIGERLGILGHPLDIYDASLNLMMRKFKKMEFSSEYDPYGFIRRVGLDLPQASKFSKSEDSQFVLRKNKNILQHMSKEKLNLWRKKDFLVAKEMKKQNPILLNLE